MGPAVIAAYVVLFATVGFLFIFAALCLGRLFRPQRPNPVKLATYECGETSLGPSDLQFNLRFYVVALVFIVFEVELAFFFPWATVFGQAVRGEMGLRGPEIGRPGTVSVRSAGSASKSGSKDLSPGLDPDRTVQNGVREPVHRKLVWLAATEVGAFLAVVLLGFFYLWNQGDLDWVRSLESLPADPESPEGDSPSPDSRTGQVVVGPTP